MVLERLRAWGAAIRMQRVAQGLRAVDLCARMGISHPTLLRAERGEPGVAAGVYLAALHILGLLDQAAPDLVNGRLTGAGPPTGSVGTRLPRARPKKDDDAYF